MPRKGLTTARTGTPAAISRSITLAHPEASAKAPWTRTTVGVPDAELVSVMLIPSGAAGCRPWGTLSALPSTSGPGVASVR